MTKLNSGLKCDIWGKRYQLTFQPVRGCFLGGTVAKNFFECLHTTYVKRTHSGTLNYELGPENEN